MTDTQLDLLADPDPEPESMTEAFLRFHKQNPRVYTTLRDLARDWRSRGKKRCGISMFYAEVRWRLSLEIVGEDIFELNDHHMAYYARALMHFEPDLDGMFETRRAPEADAWIASLAKEAA